MGALVIVLLKPWSDHWVDRATHTDQEWVLWFEQWPEDLQEWALWSEHWTDWTTALVIVFPKCRSPISDSDARRCHVQMPLLRINPHQVISQYRKLA